MDSEEVDSLPLTHSMKIIRAFGMAPLLSHQAVVFPQPQHSLGPQEVVVAFMLCIYRDQRTGYHRHAYQEKQCPAAADLQVLQGSVWQGKGKSGDYSLRGGSMLYESLLYSQLTGNMDI